MEETNQQNQQNAADASSSATEVARQGSQVTVSYVGKLQNGQVFDQSADHGGSFTFTLGVGQVIAGWDKGLMGAKKGDHLTLTIPPAEAYGAVQGHPLQNETLIFDIDVLDVKN
ncbi:MAG TPA: FKBP-type peptidyl-prolyl cis-trans isomerase [Candidatus Paceibacterota bacterium]|jgi:peptidylprolyl isomerase|nr:FKBP-type peptidyl-prolyl cis-trans isomerase [Candidatus Paceibacterota bacterium]